MCRAKRGDSEFAEPIVPDKRSRIHEVVVVGLYQPGFWEFGVGREWGGLRKGRSVYE